MFSGVRLPEELHLRALQLHFHRNLPLRRLRLGQLSLGVRLRDLRLRPLLQVFSNTKCFICNDYQACMSRAVYM